MRDTLVKLKDGTTKCGPIWEWRPELGYFSIITPEDECAVPIFIHEVESATTGDRDELARARKDVFDHNRFRDGLR